MTASFGDTDFIALALLAWALSIVAIVHFNQRYYGMPWSTRLTLCGLMLIPFLGPLYYIIHRLIHASIDKPRRRASSNDSRMTRDGGDGVDFSDAGDCGGGDGGGGGGD